MILLPGSKLMVLKLIGRFNMIEIILVSYSLKLQYIDYYTLVICSLTQPVITQPSQHNITSNCHATPPLWQSLTNLLFKIKMFADCQWKCRGTQCCSTSHKRRTTSGYASCPRTSCGRRATGWTRRATTRCASRRSGSSRSSPCGYDSRCCSRR